MQKNAFQKQQIILFTFVPKLCHFCTEFNSDFIVRFILVRFVIVTKGNRI